MGYGGNVWIVFLHTFVYKEQKNSSREEPQIISNYKEQQKPPLFIHELYQAERSPDTHSYCHPHITL